FWPRPSAAVAEPISHGKQVSFPTPPETLPSSILLAAQLSRTGLPGMRHLWDGLRIQLGDDAACTKARREKIFYREFVISHPSPKPGQRVGEPAPTVDRVPWSPTFENREGAASAGITIEEDQLGEPARRQSLMDTRTEYGDGGIA